MGEFLDKEVEVTREDRIAELALDHIEAHSDSLRGFVGHDLSLQDLDYLKRILNRFGDKVAAEFEVEAWNDGFIEGSSKKDMSIEEVQAQALARGEE